MMCSRFRARARWPLLLCVACLLFATPARAESVATLAEVEAAYAEVDLERTYSLALAALGAGGHDMKATARLYHLYAVAAAATDRADEAREAFLRVLAIDSRGKLDKKLSPKIRAPYLEARGAWADASGGKSLAVAVSREDGAPVLTLDGPLGAVSRVLVRARRKSGEGFQELSFTPATRIALPEPLRGGGFEYVVHLEDAAGNRLHELGSDAAPRWFGAAVAAPATLPTQASVDPAPYRVGAAVLATLGLGAAGTGVVFQLSREAAARKWNSAVCEAPGATRGEQCASLDDRRARAEQLSIVSYAGAGVLLAASAVTLLLAPRTRGEMEPASQSIACSAGFRAVSCSGRF